MAETGWNNEVVVVERCEQCGFDGDDWTDHAALGAIEQLPHRWVAAVAGLGHEECRHRPIAAMWSIAEYTNHVREVLFGMRFVLDSAVADPGVDLGQPPEAAFPTTPPPIDVDLALEGIEQEARSLTARLRELDPEGWTAVAVIGGDRVDGHWICRHAVHDATHHIGDVDRLRRALGPTTTGG